MKNLGLKVGCLVLLVIGVVVSAEDPRCVKGDTGSHYCMGCTPFGCEFCAGGYISNGECKAGLTATNCLLGST